MRTIFAGNWKMHLGPTAAVRFVEQFLETYTPTDDREVWLFPPALSVPAVCVAADGARGVRVGVQNVYWERAGAFTGELSVEMAADAGATLVLIGHSERRHVFGETIEETGRKLRAVLRDQLDPVLCVGETLGERERNETEDVVLRQLAVLDDVEGTLDGLTIAYEPVWAIGTGKTATPGDAAAVHRVIRRVLADRVSGNQRVRILYGGSVKPDNAASLLAEPEIDGVLVGGASIDVDAWRAITTVAL